MLEKSTAECVDIGIRVFDLTNGTQNARNCIEASSSEVTDVVILDVFVSESLQVHESGIGVSEDSMAITGDDSAFSQSFFNKFFNDFLVGSFSFVVILEEGEPFEAFLVGKSVKRSGKTVHGCRVRKIGVGKSGSDQHVGMS